MSEEVARKESARKESNKSSKEEKVRKVDKFLVGNVIALMILITSSSYISVDYINNIDLLEHPRKESVQELVHWILYFSSIGSLFFSLLSDCAFPDYQVELGEAILSTIATIVVVAINFLNPMSSYTMYACLVPFIIEMVTTPNTWAFLLHQMRFINVDIEWVLATSLLGTLVLMSVFKISSEIIRYFSNSNANVSHFFTIWQLCANLSRVLTLLMVSNRVDKPSVSFGPLATVALVTFDQVRSSFQRCCDKEASDTKKFQDIDVFYTYRFWAVLRIMIFFIPFGLGAMCVYVVSKNLENYLVKSDKSLLQNFYAYYFIGGSVLTSFYFFGLAPLLKKTKCWTKVLRHLGVAFILLMIALTYIGVLQSIVFSIGHRLKKGHVHIKLFNVINSEVTIKSDLVDTTMQPYSAISVSPMSGGDGDAADWDIKIHSEKNNLNEKTSIQAYRGKLSVYAITEKGIVRLPFDLEHNVASKRGEKPILFFLPSTVNATLNFKLKGKSVKTTLNNSTKIELESSGTYEIEALTPEPKKLRDELFDEDGIYGILVLDPISTDNVKIFPLLPRRTLCIWWLIPGAAILALADSIKLYVCMKLVFYQAPPQLRTITIAINFYMVHSTNFIYFIHSIDLPNYDLFVFIILSVVIIFFSFYVYCAVKYIPYVFTGHGKL